ncbi:MAG: hypothetical protein FWD71_02670 [Oscillospiraceae bacterium]|nr:hypothetical protein [Oscillospiraceae bacterium]
MQAINAVYENGNIKWTEKPPMVSAKVIVVFTEEAVTKENMSNEEALRILAKFKGCIKSSTYGSRKNKSVVILFSLLRRAKSFVIVCSGSLDIAVRS